MVKPLGYRHSLCIDVLIVRGATIWFGESTNQRRGAGRTCTRAERQVSIARIHPDRICNGLGITVYVANRHIESGIITEELTVAIYVRELCWQRHRIRG